jgi:hypothetical protein
MVYSYFFSELTLFLITVSLLPSLSSDPLFVSPATHVYSECIKSYIPLTYFVVYSIQLPF